MRTANDCSVAISGERDTPTLPRFSNSARTDQLGALLRPDATGAGGVYLLECS
jgi:hypothetical protein